MIRKEKTKKKISNVFTYFFLFFMPGHPRLSKPKIQKSNRGETNIFEPEVFRTPQKNVHDYILAVERVGGRPGILPSTVPNL